MFLCDESQMFTSSYWVSGLLFSVLGLKIDYIVSGNDGTVSCVASYLVCNAIFSSIMSIAGDINVRKLANSAFISYLVEYCDCFPCSCKKRCSWCLLLFRMCFSSNYVPVVGNTYAMFNREFVKDKKNEKGNDSHL